MGWLHSLGMLLDIILYSVLHQIRFSDLGSVMSSWQSPFNSLVMNEAIIPLCFCVSKKLGFTGFTVQ